MSNINPQEPTEQHDSSSSSSDGSPSHTADDLSSTADITSISITASSTQTTAEQRPPALRQSTTTTTPSRVLHNHVLPEGWRCEYDSDCDQFKLVQDQDESRNAHERQDEQQLQAARKGSESKKLEEDIDAQRALLADAKATYNIMRERNATAAPRSKTPTIDNVAQTSRRPTLNAALECKYGYHFPSSPTPSMISDLARQVQKDSTAGGKTSSAPKTRQIGYGRSKLTLLTDEEAQAKRLCEMFPTATRPVIDQMIRIYHGREGLIKAALISLSYKRATEFDAQRGTAHSPIMLMMSKPASKKLFDKLAGYFPDVDELQIKQLMYEHKEVEHEIISALVELNLRGDASDRRAQANQRASTRVGDYLEAANDGAIMKLRYLKCLYPTCEEIEVYHLLHCNDLNAQKVIEEVEKRGHKRANIEDIIKARKAQVQQARAQSLAAAAKQRAPTVDPIEAHKNRVRPTINEPRLKTLTQTLRTRFEDLDEKLLHTALECADYNEPLARRFLEQRTAADEALYTQRYCIEREPQPDVVLFPCKGVQKSYDNESFMAVTTHEQPVAIDRNIIECTHAIALVKVHASTCTHDDRVLDYPKRVSLARGPQPDLARGPREPRRERDSSGRLASCLATGPKAELRCGSRYEQLSVKMQPERVQLARGPNSTLRKGPNVASRCGPNLELRRREHPFFVPFMPLCDDRINK